MGTTAHVIVTDGARRASPIARWRGSRSWRPAGAGSGPRARSAGSTSGRASRCSSRPTTYELIERALDGWRLTGGRFDPTLLREVRAAGYDRSFELVGVEAAQGRSGSAQRCARSGVADPSAAPSGITLDPHRRHRVARVTGVADRPGRDRQGTRRGPRRRRSCSPKAPAARSSTSVATCAPRAPLPKAPDGSVAIADPTNAIGVIGTIAFDAGAVASTWRTKRAWTAPDGTVRHHLIDPTHRTPGRKRARRRHA